MNNSPVEEDEGHTEKQPNISDEEDVNEREWSLNTIHQPDTESDEEDTHDHDPTPLQWSETIKYRCCFDKFNVTQGLWNTLSLAFAFFLLFLAVNTTQWFESSVDTEWG